MVRAVTQQEAKALATDIKATYLETSARTHQVCDFHVKQSILTHASPQQVFEIFREIITQVDVKNGIGKKTDDGGCSIL